MKILIRTGHLLVIGFFYIMSVQAQESLTWNPGISANQQIGNNTGGWSFGLGTGASMSLKNNETNLFRGNSMATKMFGKYYFGKVGLSASTGVLAGSINENSLNQFVTERGLPQDQVKITKGNPLNGFFLIGPSFRFGKKLYINADIQGGMFLNNSGTVDISLKPDNRTMYRYDNGGRNYSPGFSGSISINYPLSSSTHFFINADYLQSRSSVNLLDLKNGYDVATEVNRDVRMVVAGIGITKTFGRSGMRKHVGNVKYENITLRTANMSSFAPVKFTRSNPDGSIEQITVTCPNDAENIAHQSLREPSSESYNPWEMDDAVEGAVLNPLFESINSNGVINSHNSLPSRLSMTPTTARQTQENTFGEKVASGIQSGTGIISGTIYWQQGNQSGIITNEMAAKGIGITAKPGGMTSSSYATGKMINNGGTTYPQFANTMLYVRDGSKGIASGKRQFSPVYNEFANSSCDNCGLKVTGTKETPDISQQPPMTVKNPLYEDKGNSGSNPMYEASSIQGNNPIYQSSGNSGDNPLYDASTKKGNNPLYESSANSGSNPMYEGKSIGNDGGLCGTTGHFIVGLYDANNGMQIARTTADPCGNFWFANVPEGVYAVYIKGYAIANKAYEVNISKDGKLDVGGIVQPGNAQLMISLQSQINDDGAQNSKVVVRGWDPKDKKTVTGSNQRVAGQPIRGIIVKGGRNPGGQMKTVQTDGNGQFEFNGWGKGNYIINLEIPFFVDQQALVNLGSSSEIWGDPHENVNGKQMKGWDGSVKGNSVTEKNNTNLERKGWDGSVKGNSKTDMEVQFSIGSDGNFSGSLAAQDHNSSRSNKSYMIIGNDGTITGKLNAQDFNTCRSNKDNRINTNNNPNNSKDLGQIILSVGSDGKITGSIAAQDHNSSRSNKSYMIIGNDGTLTGKLNAQDFNTCRSNKDNRINTNNNPENSRDLGQFLFSFGQDGNITGSLAAQDHNSSRSNKSYMIIGNDGTITGKLNAQDFNTCRSNKDNRINTNNNPNNSKDLGQIILSVGSDGKITGSIAAQDHNSSRSNKSYMIIGNDGTLTGKLNAQDFNTCRSNHVRGNGK